MPEDEQDMADVAEIMAAMFEHQDQQEASDIKTATEGFDILVNYKEAEFGQKDQDDMADIDDLLELADA
jgi:hypothetical protein